MAKTPTKGSTGGPERRDMAPGAAGEPNEQDFEFVWKSLEEIYRAICAQEIGPEDDKLDDGDAAALCAAEFAQADDIFKKFVSEDIALRLLPPAGREILGPVERWRWCYLHIRCCLIFGWLVCRRCSTFRSFAYYLHHYWRCVREVVGNPLHSPLTADEREDFQTLVKALAGAYRPYLADQLATVDFAGGLPDEILDGKIDCFEGEDQSAAIFERLFTAEVAPALLGKDAFAERVRDPWFWYCRCWCLCAIRFGCCLAHAHTRAEWRRCLKWYFRCLRLCFGPLVCQLTEPTGCVADEPNPAVGDYVVAVRGTAGGGGFSHYVLEWSTNDVTYHATDFHYPPIPPGGGVQGNFPVFSGLLGEFATTFHDPGLYFIRMTVHSISGATQVCKIQFELFKKDVRILGVDSHFAMDTSWLDPAAKFIETIPQECEITPGVFVRPGGTFEVSFGDCLTIQGGAFVGGCDKKKIKRYMIDSKPGFETNCSSPGWTNRWLVEYTTPAQYRFINWRTDSSVLTSYWGPDCFIPTFIGPFCAPFTKSEPNALLYPSCWGSHIGTCTLSGLYTLRLTVEDTDGVTYCDTQRVWIDNKPICAMIRIDAVPKCADLFISAFANPPDCGVPWSLPLSGIAYDEYIDELLPLSRPNNNFDYYHIRVKKQGGPAVWIPIGGPGGSCFKGFSRVGNPGTNCVHCDPVHPDPAAIFGTLAKFDLRAIDPLCSSQVSYAVPPGFTTPRGGCCVYTFDLWVYDRTIRNTGANWAHDDWAVKICNDLK